MARVICPNCGQSETVEFHGRFLVTCDRCHQRFSAIFAGHRPPAEVAVSCPKCGRREALPIKGGSKVKIDCDGCGSQFEYRSDS